MKERIIFFISLVFIWQNLFSQAEQTFIHNYSDKEYNASISNWGIINDNNGIAIAANFEGILTFNSINWHFIPSGTGILSIGKDDQNRIYYGGISDFGYLSTNENGRLIKKSLAETIPTDTRIEKIWSISFCNGKVYFFSNQVIYCWDGISTKVYDAGNKKFNYDILCFDGELFFTQENRGLVHIKNDSLKTFAATNSFSNKNLISIWGQNSDSLTIGTRHSGFYHLVNDKVTSIGHLDILQPKSGLFKSKIIHSLDQFAIATLSDGLIIADKQLNLVRSFDKTNGLVSNSIKNIYIDSNDNIWTAMQEGISYIEYGSPWKQIVKERGTILTLLKSGSNILIGTSEGLFKLSNDQIISYNDIQGPVWNLNKLTNKGQVTVSTAQGLYLIDEENNITNPNTSLQFPAVYNYEKNKKLILHSNGISITTNVIDLKADLKVNQEESWADAMLDRNQTLWATAKFKGIYKVTAIDSDNPEVQLFTEKNGLPDVKEIHITTYNDQLLFTTSKGLYQYKTGNPDNLKFVPFVGKLNPKGHIKQAEIDRDGNYYFTIQEGRIDRLEKFELQQDGTYERVYKPFRRLPDMEITVIYPDEDSILWVAGSDGLFKYDGKVKKDYNLPFNTLVNRVTSNDSLIFGGFYSGYKANNKVPFLTVDQPEEAIPTFTYDQNNLTFEFAATFYEMPEKTQFSFSLENNDNGWSKWTTETKKEYTNLAAGKYTFKVKSKNIYNTEGRLATYSFTILPPWYQTTWAYTVLVFMGILFVWFVSLVYTYRVRMQRRRLKLIVADRTYEVINQKKEIESQNKLLQEQFDEISVQRDKIQENHEKLKLSQEEILFINQKLKELNTNLEKKVDQRTKKIKATLVKLKNTNKELDTFVYRASHDLKGPISRIQGLTSLAKLESIDEADNKYYDLIEFAAMDMQGLLSKLSNAYEIMNKEVGIEKIDIPYLLSEIREDIKFLENGTKYSFDIQDKLSIETDKYLLKIIIENLIENALIFRKKTTNQPHEVKVKCYEKGKYFYFQIADNGIGINPDHSNKIFEMFFRGSDRSRGSGLGLYLVKMAAEKINGSVTMDSTLYEYSVFTLKIPMAN